MMKGGLRIIGLIISISLAGWPVLFPTTLSGQSLSTFEVARHFQQAKKYREALRFLQYPERFGFRPLSEDSTYYLSGKMHYQQKHLSQSISFLSKVSPGSVFYEESTLLGAYQYVYLSDYEKARSMLSFSGPVPAPVTREVARFLLSGIALLERDIDLYRDITAGKQQDFRQLSGSQRKLEEMVPLLEEVSSKRKSPLLAGVLSAVLPGAGQMYTGNPGRGAMALVTTGVLGLQAWESYRKDGIGSARFIIYGSLFSSLYIANVYGATIGVKMKKQQINDQINESILVTMHVPLRFLFD